MAELGAPFRHLAFTTPHTECISRRRGGDRIDNLLPDRDAVRRRLAERMGAQGTDFYSLLEAIGRDCIGAMQFLPEGADTTELHHAKRTPISDDEIEAMLADLARV